MINGTIAELAARIDAAEARLRELATELVDASVECANELRRLGHGMEVIDVITESGSRFTSIVGDPAWDTADNRARLRAHHARVEQELAAANAALQYIREAHDTWRHVENTPDMNLMLDAAIGQAFSRLAQQSSQGNYSLAELRRIVRADESHLTAAELVVRAAMLEMLR